jgi:hypothetical protein
MDVNVMNRTKVTISLSKKSLRLIDKYAKTTGFESRSRVIDEAIFTITKLLAHKATYDQKIQSTTIKPNSSEPESTINIFILMDTISKWTGILDTFERFPIDTQTTETTPQNLVKKNIGKKISTEESVKKPKNPVRWK